MRYMTEEKLLDFQMGAVKEVYYEMLLYLDLDHRKQIIAERLLDKLKESILPELKECAEKKLEDDCSFNEAEAKHMVLGTLRTTTLGLRVLAESLVDYEALISMKESIGVFCGDSAASTYYENARSFQRELHVGIIEFAERISKEEYEKRFSNKYSAKLFLVR